MTESDNRRTKTDILSMTYPELEAFVTQTLGMPRFRARQIALRLCRGFPISEMAELSSKDREKMSALCSVPLPKVHRKFVSQIDGTVKYLFSLEDGELIESVVMRYEHGLSICVSSQVGCRMGCRFCASTIGGKVRDLAAGEILGQIIMAQRDLDERISHIVMMGIGEPMDNYENVIRFLTIVTSEESLHIGARHISLSTCGVVPGIYALAKENFQITLSISLHAYNDDLRSQIMPVNNKYHIDELLKACRDYFDETGRRISFEYTLIAGENDFPEGARALAKLLKQYMGNRPFHVNLIPVNAVKERTYRPSDKNGVQVFCKTLTDAGVNATVRRKLGSDIDASCGQLRRSELTEISSKTTD